ncbi:hypothetical protein MMC30_004030 [Trapelia coarctata]|nr:hypothetical protein [Trapelia coarctata]
MFSLLKNPSHRVADPKGAEEAHQSNGVAKYFSTNNKQQSSFYAEAPAGSRHAARLQRICASVDPDVPQSTSQQGRIQGAELARTKYITKATTAPTQQAAQVVPMQYQSQQSGLPQQQIVRQQQVLEKPQPAPAKLYRYEKGGEVAYYKKSSRGETFISAPKGSVEAWTMDEAARLRARSSTSGIPVGTQKALPPRR